MTKRGPFPLTISRKPGGMIVRQFVVDDARGTLEWADAGRRTTKHRLEAEYTGGGCRSCGRAPVVRWLRVRWIGVPLPVRLWLDRFHVTEWRGERVDLRGCGCLLKPKRFVELFGTAMTQWRGV